MSRLRILIPISILVLLGLMIYCIDYMTETYGNSYTIQCTHSALLSLTKLKRDSDECFAIQRELNKFYGLLSESECTLPDIEKKVQEFSKEGFSFVNLRFFDKDNNRINLPNQQNSDNLNAPMQRLYVALAEYKRRNDDSKLRQYRKMIETLIGAVELKNLAKQTSTLVPVSFNGKAGYFYWNLYENQNNPNDVQGLVAWLKSDDIPENFTKKKLIDEFNAEAAQNSLNPIFGYIDTNQNGKLYPENLLQLLSNLELCSIIVKLQELKASLKSFDYINDKLFSYTDLGNGKYFFSLINTDKISRIKHTVTIFEILLTITIISSIFYGIKFFRHASEGTSNNHSSAKTGICLIGISSIMFVMFLGLVIFFTRYQTHQNIKNQTNDRLISVIDWLDEGYNIAKKELSDKWLQLASHDAAKNVDAAEMDNQINELQKNSLLDRLYIASNEGKILYSYPHEESNAIFNQIMPVIAKKITKDRFGLEKDWQSQINDLMIDAISSSFTDLLGEEAYDLLKAFETFDAATELELGAKRYLVFSTIINNGTAKPPIMITWLDANEFSKNYLIDKIKDSESLPQNLKEITIGMVPVSLDASPNPAQICKYSFSRDITERVAYQKRSILFETQVNDETRYGIGALLQLNPNYVIFAFQGNTCK